MRIFVLFLLSVPCFGLAHAQSGGAHTLDEAVLNAGGAPAGGAALTSTSFSMTLAVIGDPVARVSHSGSSFVVDGGFVPAYRPPAEVYDVQFTGPTTLAWTGSSSAGAYNIYQNAVTNLPTLQYGECALQAITAETAEMMEEVPPGTIHYYLVTVENRLLEEGPKGFRNEAGVMIERGGVECP